MRQATHLTLCLIFAFFMSIGFIDVICDPTRKGQANYQSLLKCEVKPTQDIKDFKITLVVWRKTRIDDPILVLDLRDDKQTYKCLPGYELADRTLTNGNVSLVITETQVEHEGMYTCEVTTNSGYKEKKTSFAVTGDNN